MKLLILHALELTDRYNIYFVIILDGIRISYAGEEIMMCNNEHTMNIL
jgi:hypothetical protein